MCNLVLTGYSQEAMSNLLTWEDFLEPYLSSQEDREFQEAMLIFSLRDDAGKNPERFRGLWDEQGILQAAAIVREPYHIADKIYIQIELIASAPWSRRGNDPRQIQVKAGKHLLEELARESFHRNYKGRLVLTPHPKLINYYLGLGFTKGSGGNMILTSCAAEAWLRR
jgi:hypothetical protein